VTSRLIATVALALGGLIMSVATTPDAAASSSGSVSAFIALAKVGASGTFDEEYQLSGPNGGTVEVAQEAARGGHPYITGSGQWSFVFLASSGTSWQWIEKGYSAWDCWHFSGVTTWTCSGPGTFRYVNGFLGSIAPYVPGIVQDEVGQLQEALSTKPPLVHHVIAYTAKSTRFGSLRCVRATAPGYGTVHACVDRHGVLVSQQGGSMWNDIALVRRTSVVRNSSFTSLGASTSSGANFSPVPL
jgi:hypothetical protein